MKNYSFLILIVWLSLFFTIQKSKAQPFCKEWINYSQSYYKVNITQKGVHRITYTQLQNIGFPLATIDPRKIQLFHRGNEQAISINGESDGIFNTTDYIEFYAEANNGTQDAFLYNQAVHQINPYYNLYSDTAAYFLTIINTAGVGKRINTFNGTLTALETYHWQEDVFAFAETYWAGQNYQQGTNNEIFLSDFDTGEGWASNAIAAGQSREYTFGTSQVQASPQAVLEIGLVGSTQVVNACNISIGNASGTQTNLGTVNVNLATKNTFLVSFNPTLITGTGNAVVRISTTTGILGIAYIRLRYPQNIDMGSQNSKTFRLRTGGTTQSIQILNVTANLRIYDITDKNNIVQIAYALTGSNASALINNTNIERVLWAHNTTAFATPASLEAVSFQNLNPAQFDYYLIAHRKLRVPLNGADVVQQYADYRASVVGGSYKPFIMNIDEVYNQFNYGERSPLALRNFIRYVHANSTPKHLLIVGASISLPDSYNPYNIRQVSAHTTLDLVPTFGFPPSDMRFATNIDPANLTMPVVPVGRLSCTNPQEVLNYLNKVKEQEATGTALWRKNFLHLSGGKTTSEQTILKAYVDIFKLIAEGGVYGGKVKSIAKNTTNSVEFINISEEVNNGVGLVTFFGHSTRDITDIEVGYVSESIHGYDNKGKYTTILANGCQLGSIFYNTTSLATDWLFTANKGATNFIGHSYIGYSVPLRRYSTRFYVVAYGTTSFVGSPIGEIVKEVLRQYNTTTDELEISVAQQMILQGDPALRIANPNKPDYATANDQLYLESIDGNPITATTDSFRLKIVVSNLGIRELNGFSISVKRTFSNGSTKVYLSNANYAPIVYQDTLTFVIRKEADLNGYGLNRLEVHVDYQNEVNEISDNNNIGILEFFLPGAGILPLLPTEYAVLFEQPITLTALASSLTDENRPIIFELDTTYLFNSPIKKSFTVNGGVSATWQPSLLSDNTTDSTVYYWRTNYADALNDPTALWATSSFTYIKNSPPGWSQGHFPQFLKNSVELLKRNTASRNWEFTTTNYPIQVTTTGAAYSVPYSITVNMSFDGLPLVYQGKCFVDGVVAMAFSRATGQPYLLFTADRCGRQPELAHYFSNSAVAANKLVDFINAVPANDYVLIFTTGNVNFSTWTVAMRNKLQDIGANPAIVSTLQNGHPYAIFGRKGGSLGTATESIAPNAATATTAYITLNTNIVLQTSTGKVFSSRIGPASQWGSLSNNIKKMVNDTYQLDLYGMNLQGVETLLQANITAPTFNLSTINASQYPYLRLQMQTDDNVNFTPAQLKRWTVIYDGVPEGFINVDAVGGRQKYIVSDKQEGENFSLEFAFQNLTTLSFKDSILVQYSLTNRTTNQTQNYQFKIKALAAKEVVRFTIPIQTQGNAGDNTLRVFVNPRIQPEIYYENNLYEVNYKVIKDNANPILEVAFDGRSILDGEIVAPQPLIHIRLRDENKFLRVADINSVDVALKSPCAGCSFQKINLQDPEVKFSSSDGITEIEFRPKEPLANGIYTLRVQGSDASGNRSGLNPYTINFEIINEATVTNFFPYPNPFSTSTRFAFTLTGSEVPDEIKIQIMTVSGKIVREITQDELGPIYVGNNLTEFSWDGTDEFGDLLANGVYLYRVIARKNGVNLQQRETSADKGFKQGFGKMYILR